MKNSCPLLALGCSSAALLSLLPASPARAQTGESFIPSTGNWSVSANWSPANVPNNVGPTTYSASITGGRTATLDIDVTIQSLSLSGVASPGAFSTVTLNAGRSLTLNGALNAGLYTQFNGTGTLVLKGGGSTSSNSLLTIDGMTFSNTAGSVFSDNGYSAFATVVSHGGIINNAGTYSIDGDSSGPGAGTGGGAFVNSGTYRGMGYTNLPFTNTGTISGTRDGKLEFGASGTSSGTVNTGATANQGVQFDAGT